MKTCFVVMPIGDIPGVITEGELRQRYADLIKEALCRAAPFLDVTRADEVAAPGTINTDIMTRIMHADLVLADITFSNPNVFYELGLRHASRAGTILIKEKDGRGPPFDVHALRHIAYENTPTGIKQLAGDLKKQIEWIGANPAKPDNSFLELATFTKYAYPTTGGQGPDLVNKQVQLLMKLAANPAAAKKLQEISAAGGTMGFEHLHELRTTAPELTEELLAFMLMHGMPIKK
jgi:hypothetical protein